MCGICGIVTSNDKPVNIGIVKRMMTRLAHRGPDDSGLVAGAGFAFGHQRLSIIDVKSGHQPMQDTTGRYTLIFNGEIYNYKELRLEFESAGHTFKTSSDTEVLLVALIHWGEAALDKISGMFAFALHDAKTKCVLMARDQFGIKPLYFTQLKSDELIFASEIKALLEHPHVRAELNLDAMSEYLHFQFALSNKTLFAGIRKIEPGCLMRVDKNGTVEERQYWSCDFDTDDTNAEKWFDEQLDDLLNKSIHQQLRSDVPLGCHLSGGLDSSLVTAIAARKSSETVHSFHGRFADGPDYDESAYARIVANNCSSVMHEVTPTVDDFIRDMPHLIYHMDEPVAGPGLFPQYHVSKLASENVKVILGGQGGDEIFGGYTRYLVAYLEQAIKGSIYGSNDEGNHLVTLQSIVPNMGLLEKYVPLLKSFWSGGLFEDMDQRYFSLINRSPQLKKMVNPDVFSKFSEANVFESFQELFHHPHTTSYINKMIQFDTATLLPSLLQVEDRVSMAVSLESRVPLLDTRIIEHMATMPPPMKFSGGQSKYALKRVAERYLPDKIVHRKDKMGFPVPLSDWTKADKLKDFLHDILLGQRSRERGVFQFDFLENLIKDEVKFGRQVWGVLCLELWMRQFLDGDAFGHPTVAQKIEVIRAEYNS